MAESNFEPRQTHDEYFPYSRSREEQLRFLLRYATLAPSHYNAQPWKFRLDPQGVDVLRNVSRGASTVDPDHRELTISCGSAIRMIEVAARYFIKTPRVLFPKDDQCDYLARVELSSRHDPSAHDMSLFHAIKVRQTNRGWFTQADIPNNVLDSCHAAANKLGADIRFTSEQELKENFASLTALAVRQQLSMPWYRLEFSSWLRSPFSFKTDGLTGFGFFAANLPLPIIKTTLKWQSQRKLIGDYNKNKVISGSPILAVISTDTDTKESWINTGRLLSHLLLELTAVGLSASFMNQAIQEPTIRNQVRDIFGCKANPQLILRIGVAKKVQWTQRIAVDDCMI